MVDQDPPAPQYEVVGVAPGPGFLWIGGYYHWYGGRWVWYRGHYERPPHLGAVWVHPRYEFRGGRRVSVARLLAGAKTQELSGRPTGAGLFVAAPR